MASVQAFLSPHSFRNVTFDASSGTAIEWNILNLPRKITTSGGIVSEYTYLADGTKVRMKSGTSYLHYLGSMVFSQAGSATPVFESMAFAEGRIVVSSSGTREVHYHITDHLGSVRSVVKADGTVIAANDYYPYGKRINTASATAPTQRDRHTFSGKEDQALTPGGAPYLDFGARMYSPDTARWLSVDPMAEKYYGIETNVYCAGNPINLVDPDGNSPGYDPNLFNYYLFAKSLQNSVGNSNYRTAGYAMLHPINALRVGDATHGSHTISKIASNFQVNLSNNVTNFSKGPGREGNAFRHVLWQAMITQKINAKQAELIGNAHETDSYVNPNERYFTDKDDADRAVDLLNNSIGRVIGSSSPKMDNQSLARLVITEFHVNGFWMVEELGNDSFLISRQTITHEQMIQGIDEISKKNKYGLNK